MHDVIYNTGCCLNKESQSVNQREARENVRSRCQCVSVHLIIHVRSHEVGVESYLRPNTTETPILYQSSTTKCMPLHDLVHPSGSQITRQTKRKQSSRDAPEPCEIVSVLSRNQALSLLSVSWIIEFFSDGLTFIPHIPVTMFMGNTMVPKTVSLPKTSLVCSARSFMRMLI